MNRRRRHEWEIIKWWMVFIIDWMKERKLFIRSLFIFSFPSFFYWKIMFSDLIKMIFFFKLGHKRFIDFLWWSCSLSYLAPYQDEWGMEKKWKKVFISAFYLFKKMSHVPHFFLFRWEKKKKRSKRLVVFVGFSSPLLPCTCRCSPFFCVCTFEKAAEHHQVVFSFFLSSSFSFREIEDAERLFKGGVSSFLISTPPLPSIIIIIRVRAKKK